jgi:glutamine synthetase
VQLVQDILYSNANRLYDLQLKTPRCPPTQPTPSSPDSNTNSEVGTFWSNKVIADELRRLRCKWLRIVWLDYTSSTRCRLIPIKRVLKTLEGGKPLTVAVTKAALGLLASDMMIPEITASGMYTCYPDWPSLRPGPAPGHASVFCDFRETDGSEAILCPRTLLRSTLERAMTTHGLSFLLGYEIEFVIMERNLDPASPDKYRAVGNDGHGWAMSRAMADAGREGSFNSAVDEIVDALDEAGILIEQFHAESAPGQYEIVLPALPPMSACDALLHARQIIECVAARHGFRMTLHPKPFATSCGSASHAHMSISSPGGNDPEVYESFYAGILKHFRAIIAFTYSNPASYERMVDSCWAGGRWVTWGTQNKEAPLRKCEDGHWEMKTMDGLTNPYFAMAAVLSAGVQGITSREPMIWGDCELDPAKLSADQRKKLGVSQMFPADLSEALGALKEDAELCKLLGSEFVQRFTIVKNAEIRFIESMTGEERRRWTLERY